MSHGRPPEDSRSPVTETVSRVLIPTNGVHITEAHYPKGFHVAKYDADGFTSAPRWFPTIEKAWAYAIQIGMQLAPERSMTAPKQNRAPVCE